MGTVITRYAAALTALLATLAPPASAQLLPPGTLLTISPGTVNADGTSLLGGSGFAFEVAADVYYWTPLGPGSDGGLLLGSVQPATGSHSGLPDNSETAPIDAAWAFFGNTGMHGTSSPIFDLGAGLLTMAGWYMTWNGIPAIALGGDPANFPGDTGVTAVTVVGNGYVLDYEAHVAVGDPSGFGGVPYRLHLEGMLSPPLPPDDDADGDGVANGLDNCPTVANPGQADTDGDGIGDACDVETCDGLDNNGDGLIDEGFPDTDGDGIADCVDVETCDGLDNNGDGVVDEGFPDTDGDGIADCVDPVVGIDTDGDGHGSIATGGDDCDDSNPFVHPGAIEIPSNGVDDDCDGLVDNAPLALLPPGTLLTITPGATNAEGTSLLSGSGFAFEVAANFFIWTPLAPGSDGGLLLGSAQPAAGSHGGFPDGSETAPVDAPWAFFNSTGMHGTSSPVFDLGDGQLTMAGWYITWNGIPNIPLGGDPASFPTDTGVAAATLNRDGTYLLEYDAHVPIGDPSGFGGVPYTLRLTGTVIFADPCTAVADLANEICPPTDFKNRGQHIKCVARVVRDQVELGTIDRLCAKEILRRARR